MSHFVTPNLDLTSVLLRHILPDGSCHIDWFLAQRGHRDPDERVLKTWRLTEDDASLLAKSGHRFECLAVRLPDHRAVYLTHEGEVSGGRGEVARVASGRWAAVSDRSNAIEFVVRFHTLWRVRGERVGDAPDPADRGAPPLGLWRLIAAPIEPRDPEAADASSG